MDGITKTRRRVNFRRPVRPAEVEANANALAAARFMMVTPISRVDACQKFNTNRTAITSALTLLQEGTPEEIAKVESGGAMDPVVRMILKRRIPLPPGKRQRRLKTITFTQEELERKKVESAVWETLGSALKNIASLPQPSDTVKIARKNIMRIQAVDRNLMTAFSWITEFSDAWTK